MATLNYKWKIIEESFQYKVMLVEYTCDNFQTHLISMPLPTEAIDVEMRIRQYAPIKVWELEMMNPVRVQVGYNGIHEFTVHESLASGTETTVPVDGAAPSADPV